MSIVDALQKAKRMGRERARPDNEPVAAPAPAARGASPAPTRETAEHTQPVLMAEYQPIEFPRHEYDPLGCEENRIIVPQVEARLAQLGSPPYRMLRTRVLQRCRTNGWSSLAITSPGPGEGKSVTALNLAISIAREGNNDVFLIDLDMRNPSMCRYLGTTPAADVTSFFSGEATARDVFFTVGIENLVLAGSSASTNNASELLGTGRLEELLAFVRSLSPHTLILLDLPPIVSTDDALVVAPKVDATVLVVSQGTTRRDGLQRALELLSDFTVAGVVINQSQESIGSDYYGSSAS